MAAISVNGAEYSLSEDGRLKNVQDWNEALAEELARKEGVNLTAEHWQVIHFLREYYDEYNIVPVMGLFQKSYADRYDEQVADEQYLLRLFPGTVPLQASRIAGLPTPHTASLLAGRRGTDAQALSSDTAPAAPGNLVEAFVFEGRTLHLTHSGNLVERDAWNERLAVYLAQRQGIELTHDHWEVIHFIRRFYDQYAIAPMVRLLVKTMRETLEEGKCSRDYLYQLFPGGPARQGSLIAGLAEPPGCID